MAAEQFRPLSTSPHRKARVRSQVVQPTVIEYHVLYYNWIYQNVAHSHSHSQSHIPCFTSGLLHNRLMIRPGLVSQVLQALMKVVDTSRAFAPAKLRTTMFIDAINNIVEQKFTAQQLTVRQFNSRTPLSTGNTV